MKTLIWVVEDYKCHST